MTTTTAVPIRPAPHPAGARRLMGILSAFSVAGVLAAGVALVKGHHVMGTTSEMPWGILIATYVFLAASASGVCMVASLGHVFGFRLFEPIARRATFLSIATLVVGFAVIATELERPFLLLRMVILSPNPSSPIWWMGTLYGIYLLLLLVEMYFLLVDDHHRARVAGTATVIAAVAAQSNLGAVFGLSHGRPFWAGPFTPVYFISLALVCGTALLVLAVYFQDWFSHGEVQEENRPLLDALGKLLALFLSVEVFFTAWRAIAGLNGAHDHVSDVTRAYLTGPLFTSFWFFEVFLGLVVPLTLLLRFRDRPAYVAAAAGMPMLAVLVMRMNFVYEGQAFSLKPLVGRGGETIVYQPGFKGNGAGFLAYTPSLVEWTIVLGALSAAAVVYVVGTRMLKLRGKEA